MDINLATFGSGVAVGALGSVTVQWIYNEWLWRFDRGSVQPMPELSDALLQKAAMAALLEMIEAQDQGEGLAPDYEDEDVIS